MDALAITAILLSLIASGLSIAAFIDIKVLKGKENQLVPFDSSLLQQTDLDADLEQALSEYEDIATPNIKKKANGQLADEDFEYLGEY